MSKPKRIYRVERYRGIGARDERVQYLQVRARTAEQAMRAVLVDVSAWILDVSNDSRCTAVDMTTDADSYSAAVAEVI